MDAARHTAPPEALVRSERAYRAEIAPVEREHRIGTVLGCQSYIDRVGQVEVEAGVLALDLACGLQDFQAGFRI